MNKILYNTAMDKITMSDECEKRILAAAENAVAEKKRHKSFRFIPVIAAAAVLVTGTVGVAAENGGFDWIRGFFTKEDFDMSDDVTGLVANVENFRCESPFGIELSPVGMIADERTLYCKLNVDSLPEGVNPEDLQLGEIYTDSIPKIDEIESGDLENVGSISSDLFSSNWSTVYEDNAVIIEYNTDYNAILDGDNVKIRLTVIPEHKYGEETTEPEIYADISFDIRFGDVKTLEINYDDYKAVEVSDTKFFIEKMVVNSMKISSYGTKLFYDGIVLGSNDLKLIMKDDTVITAKNVGHTMSCDPDNMVNTQQVICYWSFESPVNPDNIAAIYIKDLCLYKCD